ncbi:MAG: hypothetical protein K8R91_01825, partial [Phycisphaerae bacterium]|nr:hypothetical protein [Phycisphaerae bacterium]
MKKYLKLKKWRNKNILSELNLDKSRQKGNNINSAIDNVNVHINSNNKEKKSFTLQKVKFIIPIFIFILILGIILFTPALSTLTGLFTYQEEQVEVLVVEKLFNASSVIQVNISKLDSLQIDGVLSYQKNFSFKVMLVTDKGNFTIADETNINSLLAKTKPKTNLITGLVVDGFGNATQDNISSIELNLSDIEINISDNIFSELNLTNASINISLNISEMISENISLNLTGVNVSMNISDNLTDNFTIEEINVSDNLTVEDKIVNVSLNQTLINISVNDSVEFKELLLGNICKDTCKLDEVNVSAIIVEVENAELFIERFVYTTKKDNIPPEQIKDFDNVSVDINGSLFYDLNEYFVDADNDELFFDYKEVSSFNISLNESIVNISFSEVGVFDYYFYASDVGSLVQSDEFTINVVNVSINQTNITSDEVISQVVINRPVKLLKKVKFDSPKSNVKIKLPEMASNISVNKIIDNNTKQDISDNVSVVGDTAGEKIRTNLLTGNIVLEETDKENSTELLIAEEVEEVEVEYELPGPSAVEKELTNYKKQIVVSSDIHYENILAYSFIEDTTLESINLYHIVDGSRVKTEFDAYDTNNDSKELIDYIEWIVPHLSNQTYEIEIVVLNPYSYLHDNETWYVRLNTNGTANLTIWSNNSYWEEIPTDINTTLDEMRFINISCGNTDLQNELIIIDENNNSYNYSAILENDSIKPAKFLIEDYNCDNATGQFVNYMNIAGYATLIFEFTNQNASVVDYAYDPAPGWTYQEDADEASCSGSWGGSPNDCATTYDGNWSSYGYCNVIGGNAYLYVNYTKLSGAQN